MNATPSPVSDRRSQRRGSQRGGSPHTPRVVDPWREPRASSKFASPQQGHETWLRYHFQRSDLPVRLDSRGGNKFTKRSGLVWQGEGIASVDLHRWLPIFVDGLRETEWPFAFIAQRGLDELFRFFGKKDAVALMAAIPPAAAQLKQCLATRDVGVAKRVQSCVQNLARCDPSGRVGAVTVMFAKDLLKPMNAFVCRYGNSTVVSFLLLLLLFFSLYHVTEYSSF